MGVSATMKAIRPKWARSSEALPRRSSMSRSSQPSCRGSFGRKRSRLRVGRTSSAWSPSIPDLERLGEDGQVRDQSADALRAEARGHDGGEEDHEQAEAREERGHGHGPADPEGLDPRGERIQEIGEEGGQRDRDDETAQQEAKTDDGRGDREPGERRRGRE